MGKKSGRLFTHDHLAAFYPYVLEMTAEQREYWHHEPAEHRITLPADVLIICGRLGSQFEFIRCNGPDDLPVWYYNEWNREIRQSQATILEWLYCLAAEAEKAINSGYFQQNPNGTRP